MVKIRLGANNNYKLLQYLLKLLEIPKTACVFEWKNAFFQSALISVIKLSPNLYLMNFVELRILHLIELLRYFTVRSLKRNSEMQIYSKSEIANHVLYYH